MPSDEQIARKYAEQLAQTLIHTEIAKFGPLAVTCALLAINDTLKLIHDELKSGVRDTRLDDWAEADE